MIRSSIVKFFFCFNAALGSGDLSKKSILILFIPVFSKILFLSWVFLLGIITVDSVHSHIPSK